MNCEPLDVDRIERRLQAWEDRPASTYGDVARQLNQQEDDIRALIAECRTLRAELEQATQALRDSANRSANYSRRLFGR